MRASECFAVLAIAISGCGKSPSPPPALMTLSQAVVFHPEQISEIIAKGAAVDQLDGDGNTPLWRAVRFSKLESVRLLLRAGADPNTRGQMDWTPLHCATFCSSSDQEEIVELLLAHGANPNVIEPRYGDAPHHYAVGVTSSSEVVKLLIARGAVVDITMHDGSTPLQTAVASGKAEIAASCSRLAQTRSCAIKSASVRSINSMRAMTLRLSKQCFAATAPTIPAPQICKCGTPSRSHQVSARTQSCSPSPVGSRASGRSKPSPLPSAC